MAEKETSYPRKITLKTIGAQPDFEKLMKAEGKKMSLAHIFGVITRSKPGQSDLGAFVKFLGQFKAVNTATGEIFESAAIILPRFLEEQLYGALPAEGAGNVEFAIELSAKYDKDAATKYVYEARNLLPLKENAQMKELESRVGERVKALAAPKK